MKNKFILLTILYLFTVAFIGCSSKAEKSENDSKLLAKVDSLIAENRKLNEQIVKASEQKQEENKNPQESNNIPVSKPTEVKTGKYAFVLLTVVVDNGYKEIGGKMLPDYKLRNVCSPIKSFDGFNENVKYQFMDEFQTYYMNRTVQTTLKSRKCFAFDSYEGASLEREKYLINE